MASLEDQLSVLRDEVVADYFAMLREAEAHRPQETSAAVRIQSAWRGFFLRRSLARLAATCTTIQRFYRGHLGRKHAAACRRQRDHELRQAYFDAAATAIQRHFRGFFSRKYRHSYYARAAYIAAVMQNTERLRAQLQESYEQQATAHAASERARAAAQYASVLSQSHHLVSTRSCPGVFRTARHAGGVPALDGLSVEEHLWQTVRTADRRKICGGGTTSTSGKHTGRRSSQCEASATFAVNSTGHTNSLCETSTTLTGRHTGRTTSLPAAQTSTGANVLGNDRPAEEKTVTAKVTPLNLVHLSTQPLPERPSSASSRTTSISALIHRAAEMAPLMRAASAASAAARGRDSGRGGDGGSHAHSPGSRLSVQAASPYSAVEDEARAERARSARLAVSPRPFLTAVGADKMSGGNVNGAGISEGTRYGVEDETKRAERQLSARLMHQISPEPFRVAARARQLFEDAAERVVVL